VVETGRWERPPIFSEIQRLGRIGEDEMARVFNLGLGLVLVVAPDAVDGALDAAAGTGRQAAVVGRIAEGTGTVRLEPPS